QMKSVGIKEIKTNPGIISKTIEDHQYLLISKRGKPIAVATSLDDEVFDMGLKKWILLQAFKNGSLSLGQLSKALNQSYSKTLKLLELLKIPALDYDLEDELDTINGLL
ncbi:MAG: type II toxin-antitoxin system Phd/YefM family antitoxin, partial [Cocleimonas sp.]|nr:type II toxin-antitoxin system Phd/YefM family antitoxin [Cocleimonas sp.]